VNSKPISKKALNKNRLFRELIQTESSDKMRATAIFGRPEVTEPVQTNSAYVSDHFSEPQPSPAKTLQHLESKHPHEDSITKKSIDLPDQTMLSSSTTNACSSGTITNLIDMCKDGKKKGEFEKNFRTNLVDLVRSPPAAERVTRKKAVTEAKAGSANHHHARMSSYESVMSQNLFSNNLFNLKQDEGKERDIPVYGKEKSIPTNADDIFHDLEGSSPHHLGNQRVLNKYFVMPLAKLGNLNSSISKHSETSIYNDKTIHFDDGVSRIDDFDKLSFFEQIQNVEFDEGSVIDHTPFDGGSIGRIDTIEPQTNFNLNTSALNTEYNEINLSKSKSAPPVEYKPDETENMELHKAASNHYNSKANNSESLSTLQFLSPQVNARGGVVRRAKMAQTYARADSQVIETNRVDKSVDDEGQKKINQYILIKEIGRGGFGKVKLAINTETKGQNAIKIANKKKLKRKLLTREKSAFNQLASEIAIMKKMDHPNIVKLSEVIDDPNNDKLYLVMEFIKRGAVMSKGFWRQATRARGLGAIDDDDIGFGAKKMRLSETKAKKYFKHLTLGIDYMHNYTEIIHRDIKPENLLINDKDVLKISDFGISKIMEQGDDRLDNNAGTKFFLAPEAWGSKSFRGKPTDIWAAGGTLYYFLVGKPPFNGSNGDELKRQILEEEPVFPEDMNLNPKAINLIKGCLKKDPDERLTIDDIMVDPWLTDDGANPLENEACEKLEVTEEEIKKAITRIRFLALIMVTAKVKRSLNITRRNIELRKATPDTSMIKK